MTTDPSFEQLLQVNQETFAQGDYETACHTLMAAMDRARYLNAHQHLKTVEQLADEQMAALHPMELPGRFSAERRVRKQSLHSLYSSIIQQCASWEQLVLHWREHHSHADAPAPKEEPTRNFRVGPEEG
ncbi:MAG TPA: hypothetical protein VH540_03145 [Ktedonobacterales bacterium]|jgi:hypothetical protein